MREIGEVFMNSLETTVPALLARHATRIGDRNAMTFVPDVGDGRSAQTMSFAMLDAEARRIASWLQRRCAAGDRVLLLHPSGVKFVTALLGCFYAGMIAVPAPFPGRGAYDRQRVQSIVRDAGIALALTDQSRFDAAREGFGELADQVALSDTIGIGEADEFSPPTRSPGDVAFLQYTSGSTSEPKGVMVSHRNLLHNARHMRDVLGISEDTRFGGWLPMFHDMGLIGQVLTPLIIAGHTTFTTPQAFLRRPLDWLKLIDQYDITMSGGPNFAYELCVKRIPPDQMTGLDLSRWSMAVSGSEPIHAPTLEAFAQKFAAVGFRPDTFVPSYGLAEATLFVSGTNPGRPVTREFKALPYGVSESVDCGKAGAISLRIVDPDTGDELSDGHVGEIWLANKSVALGYWRRPELTAEVFGAYTSDGAGPYLRTGDAGCVVDGHLFVAGRIKELIILNGRNIFPQDLERHVRQKLDDQAIGLVAAFSVFVPTEQVVIACEIGGEPDIQVLKTIAAQIRSSLGRDFGLHVAAVAVQEPGAILRTTSGKIRRLDMRNMFLSPEFTCLYEEADEQVAERRRTKQGQVLAQSRA